MRMSRAVAPASGPLDELKSLLDLVNDPKKVKAHLEDLVAATKEAENGLALFAQKEAELKQHSDELAKHAEELKQTALELKAAKDQFNAEAAALREKGLFHQKKEKDFAELKAVFEADKKQAADYFEAKQKQLAEAIANAQVAEMKAKELIAEYEAKSAKLKAVLG